MPDESRGPMIERIIQNTPACLRQRPQWLCWKYVVRDPAKPPTKVPYDAKNGGSGDSTKPATWATLEVALNAYGQSSQYDGVGFVFTADDPFSGIDLDDSIDPQTKQLKPWAQEIVTLVASYTEVSPSGEGVKIFLRGTKPGIRCRKPYHDGKVEMYDCGRFFTVTGQVMDSVPRTVESRQDEFNAVYTMVFGHEVPTAPASAPSPAPELGTPVTGPVAFDDDEIIRLASKSSKSGDKFSALWDGRWNEYFNSRSEADSSVVFTLAFYTKDAAQIDRIFRRCGLMRDKWDETHGQQTYGQMTIDKAMQKVTGQFRPRPGPRKTRSATPQAAPAVAAGDGSDDHDHGGTSGAGAGGGGGALIPLGTRDPNSNRLVLSPSRTLPTAKAYIQEFHQHPDARKLHSYAGTILTWRGNRFVEVEAETLRQRIQPWLHDALRYQYNKETKTLELVDFESNPGTINSALESIKAYAHLPATVTPPTWLDKPSGIHQKPDPRNLLPFPSGTLNLETGETIPPTPALFNINAIDFDYDPDPPVPERWINFLEQLWGDDIESVELLQEWMGYSLVADTSQQKMLLVVGPKRLGKGTIGRVLTRLVGASNVVGPTTSSLASPFGLQPLIGKSLAIVSDARFGGESIGVVIERLLCISGEDTLTVDRKYLGSITMKLPTRFMFLTNELPRMNDASGALAGRFVILRLIRSFYGNEDTRLTGQLMKELPGILVWAIDGLKRLRARGHFKQPQAVADAVQEMEDLASPVMAFVRDCCEVGVGHRVWVDDLYNAWKQWCEQDGRTAVTNKQTFGRDLAAAVPGVVRRRGIGDVTFYAGIKSKGGRL